LKTCSFQYLKNPTDFLKIETEGFSILKFRKFLKIENPKDFQYLKNPTDFLKIENLKDFQ